MRLEQRQELRLVLAPVLIQLLDLLTLPQLELLQVIKQQLEQNPFLEKDDEEEENELPLPEESVSTDGQSVSTDGQSVSTDSLIDDWDVYPQSVESSPARELPIPLPKPKLKDFLLSQLMTTIKDQRLIEIGEYIIYELNEDGYLPVSVEEIARILSELPSLVELVLKEIQKFEPVGVAARNLQECLLVQLKSRQGGKADHKVSQLAITIIQHHFQDFLASQDPSGQDYEKLKLKLTPHTPHIKLMCGADSDLEEAIHCIKSCRPKPGRVWEGNVRYVLPEIVIERQSQDPSGEEEWVASLIDEWIPRIRISKPYQEMLQNSSAFNGEERAYLKKKWQDAKLLLEGIEKRRETLTTIADYIVKNELTFLNHESNSIKFLTLEEVAQGIGRVPSTVSRAIKGKWVQTPMGAFPLKSFFSGGKIKEYPGIIHRIKELLVKEDKYHPLRDGQIAKLLQGEGFKIARTTVVKYRTQLGIPTASKRRFKK